MSGAEDLHAARESRSDIARLAGRGDAMRRMADAAVYRSTHHATPETHPSPVPPRPGWGVLETPDGTIRYLDTGGGTPLLLLHGAFEDPAAVVRRHRALVPAGFRVIAPARYGYVGSTLPPGATPDRQADAYAALLDQLGIAKVAVLAETSGATSALRFAIRHRGRVAALALLTPNGPGCQHDRPATPGRLTRAVWRSPRLLRLADNRFVTGIARRTGWWLVLPLAAVDEQHLDGAWFDRFVSDPEVNRCDDFDRITAPTLIAYATDDWAVPRWSAHALAQTIPGAEVVAVEHRGSGLDAHTEVVTAVKALLKSTSDSSGDMS